MFLFSGDSQGLQRPGGTLPNSVLSSAGAATHLSPHQIERLCLIWINMQGTAQHTVKIHCAGSLTDGQGPVLNHLVGFGPHICNHKINYSAPFKCEETPGKGWFGKVGCFLAGCCVAMDGHCRGCWDAEASI